MNNEDKRCKYKRLFSRIQNSEHWKNEIDWNGKLSADELLNVHDAIMFFTVTYATVTYNQDETYTVKADGYRKGPAGDH